MCIYIIQVDIYKRPLRMERPLYKCGQYMFSSNLTRMTWSYADNFYKYEPRAHDGDR